jgi:hypothetical protein
MELTTGILSRADYVRAVEGAVELLRFVNVSEMLVAYGFGCDCPDEELYRDVAIPLHRLLPFMSEGEAMDYYRIGRDNLHVKDGTGRLEFLFCHESDIHFISEDAELVERLKAIWLVEGFRGMYLKRAEVWEPLDVAESKQAQPHATTNLGPPREQ